MFPETDIIKFVEGIYKFTKVFINGDWVGVCEKDSIALMNKLRSMKRSN